MTGIEKKALQHIADLLDERDGTAAHNCLKKILLGLGVKDADLYSTTERYYELLQESHESIKEAKEWLKILITDSEAEGKK